MTWTLLSNPITTMPTLGFLIFYYTTVIVSWVIFQKVIRKRVEKYYPTQPSEIKKDPYFLAWLRAGEEGILLLSLGSLVDKENLKILKNNKLQSNPLSGEGQDLSHIEITLLNHFSIPSRPGTAYPLIEDIALNAKQHALARNFILDEKEKFTQCKIALWVIAIIVGIAAYRLIVATVMNHSDTVILMASMFFLALLFGFLNREKWYDRMLTPEGKEYLQSMTKLIRHNQDNKNRWLVSILHGASLVSLTADDRFQSPIHSSIALSDDSGSGDSSCGDSSGCDGGD